MRSTWIAVLGLACSVQCMASTQIIKCHGAAGPGDTVIAYASFVAGDYSSPKNANLAATVRNGKRILKVTQYRELSASQSGMRPPSPAVMVSGVTSSGLNFSIQLPLSALMQRGEVEAKASFNLSTDDSKIYSLTLKCDSDLY